MMISMKKALISCSIFFTLSVQAQTYEERIETKLKNPLLHQKLVNAKNYHLLNLLSQNYPKQNTLNVGWLSIFRRYNSGETVQNRTALDNQRNPTTMIFDMDLDRPLDWSKVRLDKNNEGNFSVGQYSLSLETTNIKNPESPVMLMLLSNQHVVNDYLSNGAPKMLAARGYTVATLEYPNYGVSLGKASLQSWLSASRGAVRFLHQLTGKKIFIVGHSIGGPLALQAAAGSDVKGKVAGAISYGGFTDLYEMSKDQQSNSLIRFFSKPIVYLSSKDNIIDGISSLKILADENIPVLIMHGKHDGAVTPRHLAIYREKIAALEAQRGGKLPVMKTVLFNDLFHEEINNFSDVRPQDFFQVWDEVGDFLKSFSSPAIY